MKIVGIIFISLGLTILLFVAYSFIKNADRMVSPLPEENGVKVIFITPSK